MDPKSFWLMSRLIDLANGDNNCRITCLTALTHLSCDSQRVSDGLITFISGCSRTLCTSFRHSACLGEL